MSTQIAVRIPDDELACLDDAVARGTFPNRASAVRAGIAAVLRAERERTIAEEYRRAYARETPDEWVGEAGLSLGAELVSRDRRRP